MRISACVHTKLATLLLALTLLPLALFGCGLLQPAQPEAAPPAEATAASQANATTQAAPAFTEAQALHGLNVLINDTPPASDQYEAKRKALAPALDSPALTPSLRRVLAQALAFDPPRLRKRWQQHQQALDSAAALYAEHPPVDTDALNTARVERRLGPALYLVRLPGGDTAFFSTPLGARRLKAGAKLRGILAVEKPRPKPDKASGDLVDELAESARTFVAISKQDAQRLKAEREPVLAQLKMLEAETARFQRSIDGDLASLDALARDLNAVISPRLLGLGGSSSGEDQASAQSSRTIRQVKRLSHTYSPVQYYRYALPVTGKKQLDAMLKAYLDERKAEVQNLLKSTGIGRGRARANVDRIDFQAYTASDQLLSIRFEELRDTGGAHPNTAYATFVFDMKRQAKLELSDIFSNATAAVAVLSQLAERRMELVLDGHVFPEGLEPKAENFSVFVIEGQDLVFSFPPYQMASYADGPQTLRVPLCHPRLLPLLAPKLLETLGARPGQ